MTYENPYGLGFEKATEPGPDVEIYCEGKWYKRMTAYLHEKLDPRFIYRRPIKLQVGHRYVRRDGVVVKVLYYEPMNMPGFRFWCSDNKSRHENGAYTKKEQTRLDLVTHIEEPETKEEQMNTVTVNNVELTYAQIEAAHAEMMRQKAENEIKLGDIVRSKFQNKIFIVKEITGESVKCDGGSYWEKINIEKVTGTPEFMSQLRAVLEGK